MHANLSLRVGSRLLARKPRDLTAAIARAEREQGSREGPADRHIVHAECSAPGKVTRVQYTGCGKGPCAYIENLPARTGPCREDLGLKYGCFSFATNTADYLEVTGTVYYNRTKRECVKYCGY